MKSWLSFFALYMLCCGMYGKQTQVFYCDSPTGKKYHFSKKCPGLQKCTHVIRQTNILDAKNMKLTECLIEKK